MNKDAVMFHLNEALKELQRTIRDIDTNDEYGREEFAVGRGHLYHQLNTAWNGQDASVERHRECAQKDFAEWRMFPKDSELMFDNTETGQSRTKYLT